MIQYVIAWQENTFVIKYHNGNSNGTTEREYAETYESEGDAQKIIDENEWSNCYVTEY